MSTRTQSRTNLVVPRRVVVILLPLAISLVWLVYVTAAGHWGRVGDHWRSLLTMVFGSFVAGATPQGGGAVAFPVFTKVLQTPADVARTFSLSIQAVGMVTASLAIVLSGKRIEPRAVLAGGSAGIAGFVAGLFVMADPATTFWSSRLPEVYVKVSFTVVLAALAYIVHLALDDGDCGLPHLASWTGRMWSGVVLAGFLGGAATALLGSGVDVMVFLFIVVVAGLHPRVGVPTSVLAMAMVSMFGFLVLGLLDGQLDIALRGDAVAAVGGLPVDALPAQRFDVFGMWIAAVPVVVWGAPLGTVFVHWLGERRLIRFLTAMAALEVITTMLFLTRLWTDPWLLGFGIGFGVAAILAVRWLHDARGTLLREAAPPGG